MKKVLLATSALVAFTGVAAADVSISGSARFGLNYTNNPAATFSKTSLEKRMTINIDATTETDGGLELGGRIRIRSDEGNGLTAVQAAAVTAGIYSPTNTTVNGARLHLKTGGFTLAVGNINGAIDDMATVLHGNVGLNGNGYHNAVVSDYAGYASTGNNNGIEAIYTAGDFKAHLSFDQVNDASANDNRVALALQYNFGDWTAELGVQDSGAASGQDDFWTIAVKGQLGDFGVGFAYGSQKDAAGVSDERVRINGSYAMGATTVTAFVADGGWSDTALSVAYADSTYGIGATYDLGGATLVGGISRVGDAAKTTVASAGIKFNF